MFRDLPIFWIVWRFLEFYGYILGIALFIRTYQMRKKTGASGKRIGIDIFDLFWDVILAVYTNKYKEDKIYNSIVWQVRILLLIGLSLLFL